ncbi:Clavaminate synthase-like protein [Hysterangium stoloniferum]|nr:Clavaminate synthase-like protein [Hysterangium stoloniferum]
MATATQQTDSLLDHARKVEGVKFSEIPIIDLQHARNPDFALRRKIADDIRQACLTVGFFYIKNHGVPEELAIAAVENAKPFWALPEPDKLQYDIHNTPNFKGYTAFLAENVNPENRGDLHEGYEFGWEEEDGEGTVTERPDGSMAGNNIWPAGFPDFRKASLTFFHAVVRLGQALFPLFALALDLTENFFDDKVRAYCSLLKLLIGAYLGEFDDRVIGIGAHTDYECFTILWQDDNQALQVLNTESKWVDAVPIRGTFVVNLGDQFARWTNDVFKSTVHRAVNRTGVRRYSMPLFFGTDYNVTLEALPSCVSEERPAKYAPVNAGDYVQSRLAATYAHSANKA